MEAKFTHLIKKHIVYILLSFFIVMNIMFFPELLNHKDIKVNDMSWIINNKSDILPKDAQMQIKTLDESVNI